MNREINRDPFKRGQVKTKGKYITLYPNFMGYKRNGYKIDTNKTTYQEITSHLMESKSWYIDDAAIQDEFDEHWHKLKGSWK
tara:strand:+ start:17 stop:262 length:246 start_codon:yes stop_codon:yes gene_type:complete